MSLYWVKQRVFRYGKPAEMSDWELAELHDKGWYRFGCDSPVPLHEDDVSVPAVLIDPDGKAY